MNKNETAIPVVDNNDTSLGAKALAFFIVCKPFIILMVLISTLCGMYLAGKTSPDPTLIVWTLIGIGLATAGAASLNNYIDRDIDKIMKRTRKRPLAAGSVEAAKVLVFGLSISGLSILVSALFVNATVALLNAAAIFIYVVAYTKYTKRITPWATYIGGVGGALPPVIGYAAVMPTLDMNAFVLFLVIFAWQHPHFWALALKYIEEYRAAGVQNHPVAMGVSATKRRIALWSAIMALTTILPYSVGIAGVYYLAVAALIGLIHIVLSVRFMISEDKLAMRIFFFSLLQLPTLYCMMIIDITL